MAKIIKVWNVIDDKGQVYRLSEPLVLEIEEVKENKDKN